MILKDKFQKNPNMYFPDLSLSPPTKMKSSKEIEEEEDWSDADTLVHNMSEGSFDKDSGLSAEASTSDKSAVLSSQDSGELRVIRRDPDLESIMSGGISRSITTPIRPVKTQVHLESNPSVILDKKTLRNYTPRESSCLLRQFEEERLYSGGGARLGHAPFQPDQFSSLTGRKGRRKSGQGELEGGRNWRKSSDVSDMTRDNIDTMATCTSNVSAWSAASFDWHAGPSPDVTKMNPMSRDYSHSSFSSSSDGRIANARVPPDGAPATNDRTASDPKLAKSKPQRTISADQKKSKVDHNDNSDDGLGNLRKLLQEGKIAGLNDKPPAFTPPSPPSKASVNKSNKKQKAPSPRANKSTENNNKKKAQHQHARTQE